MFTAIAGLFGALIKGATGYVERKQELKAAVNANKVRLAQSQLECNHEWEMKSLMNAGWKDDVLFYAIIGMYVYSAIDPEGATRVFQNWALIPDWFRSITLWLVASIIGVKKLGDYLPQTLEAIKGFFK